MAKIEIKLLQGVNGLKFGANASSVHKVFGNNFENDKNKDLTSDDKDYLLKIAKEFSKMSGRPLEEFTKYLDKDMDFEKENSDYYSFCMIDYDYNEKFSAISIYSDQNIQLFVEGKDCSKFDLKTFLSLADDFVIEEEKTIYKSYSRQISVFCPDGDEKVKSITFAIPGYYDLNEKN